MQKIFAEFSIIVDEKTTIEITIWKENNDYEISSKVIKTQEIRTMVYLECPHCKETTEHQILTLTNTKVVVRCTECMLEWTGKIILSEECNFKIGDKKQ